jgi:prepilin-type N-terminal cleavage/methylation domain-containing protein
MHIREPNPSRRERGTTLAELMIALVILSIGILAVAQLFPSGTSTQVQSRMANTANYYTQEKLEQLRTVAWADADLTVGRHPISGSEALGEAGQWQRFYEVSAMTAPLANLKKVEVTVQWNHRGIRSVTSTTYVRR